MREKEKFGKKPVRRSKPEEKEKEPAKVYRPRTAKVKGWEPRERSESNESESGGRSFEQKQERPYKRKEEYGGEKREERRSFRKDSDSSSRETRGGRKEKSSSPTYKPRTLKGRGTAKEETTREKRFDDERSSERREENRRERRPERTRDFDKRDFDKKDTRKKSYYEEKYSKPKFERPAKSKFEKTSKPISERIVKGKKTFATPPEIDNELKTDKDGLIRLNKYIANSGLCSRREADEYITKGQITVNGVEIRELGTKVKLTDEVRFKDKSLDPEKKVYILLNKPKDYITTVEDPNATRTVMELIEGACQQRVYPVGRLDRNSTGLLLFTNDGELTKQLTHPSFLKKKIYEVGLDKDVKKEDVEIIRTGIEIDGDTIAADAIEYIDDYDKSVIGIEIHSGQNRIVRRIFEKLNYRVVKLDRVYFAGLTKKNLPRGKWRFLTQKEVNMLKMNRFS